MAKELKELRVSDGKIGNFTFTLHVGGLGMTAEDAWEDCVESIAMDGLGCIPDLPDIELEDEEDA